ncbi:MAG: hypothetical protein N4A72_16425 [Bacteroidales bacterium]|jgi:multidrug resistance efflux pump|nr:hypothetical protein [Bacteroidales bacterium]
MDKRITLLLLFVLVTASIMFGQAVKFTGKKDMVKVFKGDLVMIEADTAYIINKKRAMILNSQLDELQKVKVMYNSLTDEHSELLAIIKDAQKYLNKILKRLEKDGTITVNNLDTILTDFDRILADLKSNNKALTQTNSEMKQTIAQLESNIKELKKEAKWIWWNGAADKLFALAGGIGIGILIGVLL